MTAARSSSRSRRVIALAVAALLLAGAAWAYWRRGGADDDVSYVTATVERGPVTAVVTATGELNPVTTVQVGTYVSGPIQAIDVDFNSPVQKNQRVAKIDPAPFTVKVHQQEANVAHAKARVDKARADLTLKATLLARTRSLFGTKIVAKNDLDIAESNHAQAVAQVALDEASVRQAEAALEEARVNLAYTDIRSPVDGVVVARNVDVGQTVAASFQTPTLFLIAEDLTKMKIDASVSEADVGRVVAGQPSTFTVDAYPGRRFTGDVAQVRNAPSTVANVVTYDVVIAVDNADLALKPGMTASVTITTARREDVLRVPARALRFRPELPSGTPAARREAATVVWVVESGGRLRDVTLTPGVRDPEWVEVLAGELREGELLATGYRRDPAAQRTPVTPFGPMQRR